MYKVQHSGFDELKNRTFVIDEEINIIATAYGYTERQANERALIIANALNKEEGIA